MKEVWSVSRSVVVMQKPRLKEIGIHNEIY